MEPECMYVEHEVKRELVPSPEPQHIAAARPAAANRGRESIIKLEAGGYIKVEDTKAGLGSAQACTSGVEWVSESMEAAQESLYADHKVKQDLVLGPEQLQLPDIAVLQPEINQQDFELTGDKNGQLTDDPSDSEMDVDDEACIPPVASARNAEADPAAESDLNSLQAQILAIDDQSNNKALTDLVPRDCCSFDWKKDKQTFTRRRASFTGTPGPTFPVTDETRVVDVFYKMFDGNFIDKMCTETNRYAGQKIARLKNANMLSTSRLRQWTPTKKDEMIAFLALIILQGLYPMRSEQSYFAFNGFGTMPHFCKIMSYYRYLQLNTLLHFVDDEKLREPTKLSKIQPVIDYFNQKFTSLYYPSQEITIDESHLKWHGRLDFARKILSRASQVGVKTYELSECSSGYLWKFIVYAGENKPTNTSVDDSTNNGPRNCKDVSPDASDDTSEPEVEPETNRQTAGIKEACPSDASVKMVYDLVEPLFRRGHTLIMDCFYNSPLLARYLKRQGTDCYGTLRLNRKFVPSSWKTLTKCDLQRGKLIARYCSDLSVMVWRDANLVSMISTYHSHHGTKHKHKPIIVLDYNKSMGGVSRKDKLLSAQPIERYRNKLWYIKLFRRMFNVALFNCFIIYGAANPKMTHRQFRTILAEDLLKIHLSIDLTSEPQLITVRSGCRLTKFTRPNMSTSKRPKLTHRHFPVRSEYKRSRCWMCAQEKLRARTVWKCLECDVNLCIAGCFMKYHS